MKQFQSKYTRINQVIRQNDLPYNHDECCLLLTIYARGHQGEWTWCICITPSTKIMTITTNSTPYSSQHHHHPEPTSSQHQAFCNSTDALYILMVRLFPRNHHCQINKIICITQSFRLFLKLLSLHLF